MKRVRDYALGWVLLALFVVFWIGQTLVGWREFAAGQAAHGAVAELFGDGGYVWSWGRTTLENWQSEMLQLFAMVVLTSFLISRGSAESKDSDEEMRAALDRVERRLDVLARGIPAYERPATNPGSLQTVPHRAAGDEHVSMSLHLPSRRLPSA